ncbi:hypothetical protein KI387_018440, partial [Taxus chinensis]
VYKEKPVKKHAKGKEFASLEHNNAKNPNPNKGIIVTENNGGGSNKYQFQTPKLTDDSLIEVRNKKNQRKSFSEPHFEMEKSHAQDEKLLPSKKLDNILKEAGKEDFPCKQQGEMILEETMGPFTNPFDNIL